MAAENVEIVRQGWDAWIRGDQQGLLSHFDPELVVDMSHWRDWPEAEYQGMERVERFLTEWLDMWDDYEVGVDDVIAAPDGRVVSLYWHRGKGRDSGLPMEFRGATVMTLSAGKVTRAVYYDDRAEALQAAGLQTNEEIIRQGWDAWLRGDLEGLFRTFDTDVVWEATHVRDWPEPSYHGIEGAERFLTEWLEVWDDYRLELEDVIPAPDGRVVSVFRHLGKGRDSGVPMDMPMAHIATLRDGRITRIDNYSEPAEALRAAGIPD